MADNQKSKGTQGGSSKQHSEAGKQSRKASSRDSGMKSQQGASKSGGSSEKGNDKNR